MIQKPLLPIFFLLVFLLAETFNVQSQTLPPPLPPSMDQRIGRRVIPPLTTGFHSKKFYKEYDPSGRNKQIVIWSNLPRVEFVIIGWALHGNRTIVDPLRLDEIFQEQHFTPTYTSADEEGVLRSSKILGANAVVFAHTTVRREKGSSPAVFNMRVAVWEVSVETGEVQWKGTAVTAYPGFTPEQALSLYVELAIAHALCRVEGGYQWIESSIGIRGGCKKDPGV